MNQPSMMRRKKVVTLKKLVLAVISCFCMGWGTAHANGIKPPALVQQVMQQDPALAIAFGDAAALMESRRWSEAAHAWLHLFEKASTQYGEGHIATAVAVFYLGDSYREQKKFLEARPLLERAADAFERMVGSHLATALILNKLSALYEEQNHHDKAVLVLQRSLLMTEGSLGLDHLETAEVLNNLGSNFYHLAKFDQAQPLQQRALAIHENVLGSEHLRTAKSLNNLALTHAGMARYETALSLQKRALAIHEKVFGSDHPSTATGLSNLALTYYAMAQHEKALPLQLRALAIDEKNLQSDHPDKATSMGNLALIYSALAQHDKALPLQQRALEIYEKALGSDHPKTANSLGNLAITFVLLSQHEKALPLQQRVLRIYEKVLRSNHRDIARSLGNLALTYAALAQHEKALSLQQRALTIIESILGPDHPDAAIILNNLALTFTDIFKYEKALEIQRQALKINQKSLGPEHPDTAGILSNLSWTLLLTGQPELSAVLLKSTINTYQTQRERVSNIGTDELKSYTKSVGFSYKILASILTDFGRLDEAQLVLDMLKEDEQFEFVRRSSNADPRRSRMGYNATEQVWVNRYRQVADRLAALGAEEVALQKQAKLGLSPEQQQRQKALAADLAVARQAFDAFLNELRTSFAQKGPARAVEVVETSQKALRDLQGLLKGLGDDAVLLQYYVTDDKVGMLLTTPGVQLARSSQVNAKDLNRQIAEFRRLLRDPKSNPQPAAQALYQLLVAPVAQDLAQAGAKTVMLSLDGALRYVPFAALHDGQQYLAQKWNLPMYTRVTKDKLRDAVAQEWQAAALGLTQAVGEFDALPAVRAEMRSIVKDGRTGVLPGEVHLDKAFSAARLKDVSQRPFQLLHVASHFRFSPGTEVNSFLLLGDGQQLTLGDIRTQNFRFDQVDLLTLSACDTGLGGGRDAQGREIEGFGVIAQQQGAKAVLATLWPVADQSTALLMADMYKRRQSQRLTKIEALRQAQLSLMAQPRYAHPFYWAPFILMGNWK